ncbi:hypothetical protein yc1106_04680 [Curvularia clavata]|uniref:Uncharacterized protein n=1 Tax=Curvularia clavata TaxID=95742 RepID=A0A9Q9DTH9_CURCL|nr:hypothetical protein yc1106_04680 [Curvularia clavata]
MPRPPRAKVASRVAKPTKPRAAPAAKQQPESIPAPTKKAKDPVNSFSEDSDGLVTRTRSMRSRRGMPGEQTPEVHEEAELTMTGALPTEEEQQQHSVSLSSHRTPESSASKRARTTRSSGRKSTGKTSPAVTAAAQQDVQAESPHVEEDSGFGDLTFSSLGSNSPAHGTRPPSAVKVGATPAHERSLLALTNFKRRARQPSLLRMVQQTTDVEDNDEDTLDNTDNFDFDDFLPHAESTPLNVRRHAPEEEVRNDSGTHVSSSGSRGRKRKLSPVVQVPRSSPPPSSPQSGRDTEPERSHSPSLPEVISSREVVEQSQEDQEPMSDTLASPKSSSPIREISRPPPSPTQIRRRGRRVKTPIIDNESEGDETETPAKARRASKKKAEQSISTAQLKDLLPRRRNRFRDRDEFDIESSEDVEQSDSDQDELQMPERRIRQRQRAGKLPSPKATKKTMVRGNKTGPGKVSKAAQKATRTYSRRISSDKENETSAQNEAETTEVSAIEHSEKLAAIRKKFEEVDAFELEFEDVDPTTSSSPFR